MKAFVIFRDRVTYGNQCTTALEAAGLDVVVVDHGSSWPPAVEWLVRREADDKPVLYRGGGHPRGLWSWLPFQEAVGTGRYLVTDPDVVPAENCPADWVQHLNWVLDAHPEAAKAGTGLRTDNIPLHYSRRQQAIDWEAKYWNSPLGDGTYRAPVDTTLALYREQFGGFQLDGSLRTGPPYLADHLAWHENLEDLPEEIRYYYEHAEPGISHWAARGHSVWGD